MKKITTLFVIITFFFSVSTFRLSPETEVQQVLIVTTIMY